MRQIYLDHVAAGLINLVFDINIILDEQYKFKNSDYDDEMSMERNNARYIP